MSLPKLNEIESENGISQMEPMNIGKDEPSLKGGGGGVTKASSKIIQKSPQYANYQGQLRHRSNDYTSEINATNKVMTDSDHTQEEVKFMHHPSESVASPLNN